MRWARSLPASVPCDPLRGPRRLRYGARLSLRSLVDRSILMRRHGCIIPFPRQRRACAVVERPRPGRTGGSDHVRHRLRLNLEAWFEVIDSTRRPRGRVRSARSSTCREQHTPVTVPPGSEGKGAGAGSACRGRLAVQQFVEAVNLPGRTWETVQIRSCSSRAQRPQAWEKPTPTVCRNWEPGHSKNPWREEWHGDKPPVQLPIWSTEEMDQMCLACPMPRHLAHGSG